MKARWRNETADTNGNRSHHNSKSVPMRLTVLLNQVFAEASVSSTSSTSSSPAKQPWQVTG
jgi:hypothetical protein